MRRIGLKLVVAMAVGCVAESGFAQTNLQYPASVQPAAYESLDYYADGSGAAAPSSQPPVPAEAAPANRRRAKQHRAIQRRMRPGRRWILSPILQGVCRRYQSATPWPRCSSTGLAGAVRLAAVSRRRLSRVSVGRRPRERRRLCLDEGPRGHLHWRLAQRGADQDLRLGQRVGQRRQRQKLERAESYWIDANQLELDQLCIRAERVVDSVQQDHVDWGFRSTLLYGTDYRYMTAGGWFSYQLLQHNQLYGVDPTEQYFEVYIPGCAEGLIVRTGRWIACPDIETQFAPDNYMGSHSILFTFDTYTQTGVMATVMMDKQWTLQACIFAGTDMAPWYPGATPTGMFGTRWVSCDNNDSIYTVLNAINNAKFRYFMMDGQLEGHDNFNYLVSTWQHKFTPGFLTKTEGYFMWQRDAVVGGTPSFGPVMPFGGGGGFGAYLPGTSLTYGMVNYTELELSKKDFLSIRNEWWNDERGERSGFAGIYTSNAIGITHNFTQDLQIRPEIGYYRNWDRPAFNNGTEKGDLIIGTDMTLRF